MTDTATTRSRAVKSEGQWALGEREPLNHNEEFKAEDNPLNVRRRIIDVYAKEGFDSIPADDLRGRFRWMGLYTQRKPGIDGGRTASLEPHELDDDHFMMRIRLDGGQVTTDQLAAIGEASTRYARDTADVTDRMNIQFHWIDIENVPAVWELLESQGLWTQEACGDCPRVVLGSPVAGRLAAEKIDPTPQIEQIKQYLREDQSLANLPRKYKTSLSWFWDSVPEINDCSFVGVEHPEHGPGFDLMVGGGLSTWAHFAPRLGVWIPPEEVPVVWKSVTEFFRDYGYRRLRNKARLKYLVRDMGAEKVREILETEFYGKPFIDGPAAEAPDSPIDYVGVTEQKDGKVIVGFAPVAGRVSGSVLTEVAEAAREAGSDAVAFTALQKVLVLDVEPEKAQALIDRLRPHGLHAQASPWRRGTIACTGLEYCKLAIVDTKQRSIDLVADLDARLADVQLDRPIAINVNGCANSCARFQTGDLGFKGQIVQDDDGNQVEGFQVSLGGGLGAELGQGRKVRGHKVTSAELGDYVERVVRRYATDAEPGEHFASWAQRVDEDVLA